MIPSRAEHVARLKLKQSVKNIRESLTLEKKQAVLKIRFYGFHIQQKKWKELRIKMKFCFCFLLRF